MMYTLEQVLICTYCEIAVNGWVSTKEATASLTSAQRLLSTKDKVRFLLKDTGEEERKALMRTAKEKGLDLFSDEVKEEVQAATDWARNLVPAGPAAGSASEYDLTVFGMARIGQVDPKKLGFAVSILPSFRRQRDQLREYSKSEWVGTIRDKIECYVTVAAVKESNPPGEWWLITVRDADDNVLKWFSKEHTGVIAGETIMIKGQVSSHDAWGDRALKSTKLNRVKILVRNCKK